MTKWQRYHFWMHWSEALSSLEGAVWGPTRRLE
jgi:hypothetical protein